jgi:hypothetical protein
MGSYYVEPDNWTKNIPSPFTSDKGTYLFNVNLDAAADPAGGCQKEFVATYRCGNNDGNIKTLKVNKEAYGQNAKFDCSVEYAKCNDLILSLGDDGFLRLKNSKGATLWTNATASTRMPESLPSANYAAKKGKRGVNYLKSGEFLNLGEWIGSPTGKYRLMMDSKDNQLKVLYNRLACDKKTGPDTDAANVYLIPPAYLNLKGNMGKLGFVNDNGQFQLFPDEMTKYVDNYTAVGPYNIVGGDLEALVTSGIKSEADCEKICNKNDQCAGFVFDKTALTCQFKNDTVYQTGNRVLNKNNNYYLRTKGINGEFDVSCPSDINDFAIGTTKEFADIPQSGVAMTPTTKCKLALYTDKERKNERGKFDKMTESINSEDGMNSNINYLSSTYSKLQGKLANTKNSLSSMFEDLTGAREDIANWSGEELAQLTAMEEDRDLNMLSQNYRHIMWSILAILAIMGTINFSKRIKASA